MIALIEGIQRIREMTLEDVEKTVSKQNIKSGYSLILMGSFR